MNSSSRKLLAVTLLFPVEALHLQSPTPEGQPDDGETPQDQPGVELTHAEASHLPGVRKFDQLWTQFDKTNKWSFQLKHRVPVMPRIKLVMGVFTRLEEAPYRDIIRKTWMSEWGVCKAPEGEKAGCGVYVTFVHGRRPPESFLDNYNDTLVLADKEAMNEGKTLSWMRSALGHYPWATHIGKMDTDVFPKWWPILEGLSQIPIGCETFVGRPWRCRVREYCPPMACGPPSVDGRFNTTNADNASDSCWIYMQGGLYIASRGLLLRATEPNGYWDHNYLGPEDVLAGHAIAEVSEKPKMCVRTWPRKYASFEHTHHHLCGTWAPCYTQEWADYYCNGTKQE